jgi:RNA polymerase sigma-70 factor (ECF subfamily)
MPGQRHRQKFAEVVDANYKRIFRGALSVTGDRHLAEEIVQDTFVVAFKKFGGFSDRASAFTWLYGIMLNKYRDHCRRGKLRKRLGFVRGNPDGEEIGRVVASDSTLAENLARHDEGNLLMRAVEKLPFRMRTVVAMHYFDGLRLSEIAEVLQCRPGTVKSRLFSARKRLYDVLRQKIKGDHENAMPRS